MSTTTSTTHLLAPEIVEGIALVGKIVTFRGQQFKVHSVEGRSWFACDRDGSTLVDLQMTPATWMTSPVATIVPMGHSIGEGFSSEIHVYRLRRGVCLTKSWV